MIVGEELSAMRFRFGGKRISRAHAASANNDGDVMTWLFLL